MDPTAGKTQLMDAEFLCARQLYHDFHATARPDAAGKLAYWTNEITSAR
jgi:hypothetical protein